MSNATLGGFVRLKVLASIAGMVLVLASCAVVVGLVRSIAASMLPSRLVGAILAHDLVRAKQEIAEGNGLESCGSYRQGRSHAGRLVPVHVAVAEEGGEM